MELAAFLVLAVVVIVTPGPDTALTVKNTLAAGRDGGVATALGVVTGQVTWALATSVGLAGLLLAFEPAFVALKLAGAAYLVYLGAQSLLAAARRRPHAATEARPSLGARAAYRQGLLSNLGNPKMAVFFASLLPQFAPTGGGALPVLFGLGLVFAAMTLAWLTAYSFAVAKAGAVLRRPAIRRAFDALTGIVLVALGARLATERR